MEEATGKRKGRCLGIGGEKVEENARWRGKKGRGGFQERIEGESNLLRRTHTPLSILLRPPRGARFVARVQAEHSHKRPVICALSVPLVNEQLHVHPTNGTTRPPPSGSSYDPRIAVFWHTNPGAGSAYTVESSLVGARPQHSRRPRLVSSNRSLF